MTEANDSLVGFVADLLRGAHLDDDGTEARRIAGVVAREADPRAAAARVVDRRKEGMPLGYALGRQTFLGIELLSEPGALVPREETELLGRTAVARITTDVPEGEALVVDMCTGSGNLASAIASLVPRARVWASDLTDGCVNLARKNVAHLGLADRMTVVQGDLFAPLAGTAGLEGRVDVVVCNPPYISTGKLGGDRKVLLDHEPREAFDGGPYGLSIHQRVIKDALAFLKPRGTLLFEIGAGQAKQVTILFERARAYDAPEAFKDERGEVRVIAARKKAD
ncbi:MAG: HemK/PrmC family methyltransferase [Polyangiaceae bacterium]